MRCPYPQPFSPKVEKQRLFSAPIRGSWDWVNKQPNFSPFYTRPLCKELFWVSFHVLPAMMFKLHPNIRLFCSLKADDKMVDLSLDTSDACANQLEYTRPPRLAGVSAKRPRPEGVNQIFPHPPNGGLSLEIKFTESQCPFWGNIS